MSGKILNQILLEVLMNCTKHFLFEQFFNGKLFRKIHDLLSVPIIFFWISLLGAISR